MLKFFSIFCCSFLLYSCSLLVAEISVQTFQGAAIRPYNQQIIRFVDQIYRESPYLYNGDDKEYEAYLDSYAKTEDAIVCLAFDDAKVIGIAAGMPMSKTREIYQKALLEHEYHLDYLFYLGEFGLHPDYRAKGIEEEMLKKIEHHTSKRGNFNKLCIWEIQRSSELSPNQHRFIPQNAFWKKNGFICYPVLNFVIYWTDINEKKESPHKAIYWIKTLNR